MSKILIDKNQINEAKSLLSEAGKFAESKMQLKKDVFEIEQLKLRIAQQENNPEQELISLRKLNELEKQLTNSDSEKNLERSNILAQKERYANKLSLANAQFEKGTTEEQSNYCCVRFVIFHHYTVDYFQSETT